MRRLGTVLIAAIIGASALAGCGGSDHDSTSAGHSASTGNRFSVESALRELPAVEPADDQPLRVFAGELGVVAELADLPKPTTAKSTTAWYQGLGGPKVYISPSEGLGLQRMQTGAMRRVLGFDARDVQSYASVESLPDEVTVLSLAAGTTPKKGVTKTGDGKVGDIDLAGAADAPFPFIFDIVQRGGKVALAKSPKLLSAWKGRGETSLADHEAFLEVAKALDKHSVYDVVLSDRPPVFSGMSAEQIEDLEDLPALIPRYDAVGIAEGVEHGKPVEYIAYLLDDAAAARDIIENVWKDSMPLRLNAPMADYFDVEGVTAKGDVVVVKVVDRQRAGDAVQMLLNGDIAFIVAN